MYIKIFSLFFCILINSSSSFKFSSSRIIRRQPIKASMHGVDLGLVTVTTGLLLDNTISKPSLEVLRNNSRILYEEGMKKSYKNLLILGPSYYYGVEKFLIHDFNSNPELLQILGILGIHSIGYYSAHRTMHRNKLFQKYHYFHHQFNDTLVPSIGNAVSEFEFTLAYMLPFVVSVIILNPNAVSLDIGIMIVSIMNLIIHCQELEDIKWNEYFVAPKTHLYHHQSKNNFSTYSAPTFNLENIGRKLKKLIF